MRLPQSIPARPFAGDQPVYALVSMGGIEPQDWIRELKCAAACARKAGTVACIARCLVTGEACDGGIDNCSGI
jgi:hypothetical protein